MATFTPKNPYKSASAIGGGYYVSAGTFAFDSSYPTGGESLTGGDLLFPSHATIVQLVAHPASGFLFEYDYTNSKLKAFSAIKKYTATDDAASINAVTAQDEAVTVTGLATTDEIVGARGPDALEARAVVKGARISGANTATLRMENSSAASVDPASGTYTFFTVAANGAAQEIANTTDLSALTAVRIFAVACVSA